MSRRRSSLTLLLGPAIGLTVLVAVLLTIGPPWPSLVRGATSSEPPPAAPSALSVNLTSAARERWPQTLPAVGSIAAWQEVVIGAEIGGLRLSELLVEGAVLAVVVVGLFLRDLRATLISAVALPLSILPTFLFMQWMGFTLNIVTLLSLSLVVGVLVDDAIVEIENIVRHMAQGKEPLVAAREAADEIGLPVIATTFTLIAVFLPTAFMPGLAGKFFVQFGWTSSVAVFFSLAVARMLTPMMGAGMMPIALGFGADPSFRAPMAIVVIGGLITSTFLSLLVIPVLYELVDDLVRLVTQRRRPTAANAPPPPGSAEAPAKSP